MGNYFGFCPNIYLSIIYNLFFSAIASYLAPDFLQPALLVLHLVLNMAVPDNSPMGHRKQTK